MRSRRSVKRCLHILLAGIAMLSPALPTLAEPLGPIARMSPAIVPLGAFGSYGSSSSSWGVSAFAQVGRSSFPGGSGYLYTICDTFIFRDASKVPKGCSSLSLPFAPYRKASSLETGYKVAASVCPGEFDNCAAGTKLVSAEGFFSITEDVAVLPSGQPPNPQNYDTYDVQIVGLLSHDVMHVNSRRLPIGTPVEIETDFTEHGSERVVCGGASNDTSYGDYNANFYYYAAYLGFDGYNRTWSLTGECIGDQWYQKPMASDGGPYHEGFRASSKFLAHVGDALPFASSLSTEAEANDCVFTSGFCGQLAYSIDSAEDFTVSTQFQPLTREVSLSFDSGAPYQ